MQDQNVSILCAEFPKQPYVSRRGRECIEVDGIRNDSYRGKFKRCEPFLEVPGRCNQEVRQPELGKKGLRERFIKRTVEDAVGPPAGKPENARDCTATG